jgi:hypothetical protein
VAWLAAVALKKLKKAAWAILLSELVNRGSESVALRHGAHNVFKNQKKDGFNDLLASLMKALEADSVPELTIVAANDILKRMNTKS